MNSCPCECIVSETSQGEKAGVANLFNGVWLPQSSNRSTNIADPKRVYHNWTFGKRGYDVYVNMILTPVLGNRTGVIKVLKALRKQLAT